MGYRRYNEVFIDVDGKKIKLFNSYGFFAAEYVKHSKLPDYRMRAVEVSFLKQYIKEKYLLKHTHMEFGWHFPPKPKVFSHNLSHQYPRMIFAAPPCAD